MNKAKMIGFIVLAVIFCYIILIAAWPVMTDIVDESSATVGANPNIDEYTGAQEGLEIMPFVLFFVPAVIGIAAIVITLRSEGG